MDLVPPEQARLEITDRAAEVRAPFPSRSLVLNSVPTQHLQRVANQQKEPLAGLRILVESGGCHGYQYKMTMSTAPQPDD